MHPVVERYREAVERFTHGDPAAITDAIADDVVWHEAGNPEPIRGKQAVVQRLGSMPGDSPPRVTLKSVLGDDEHLTVFGHAAFQRGDERCEYDYVEEMSLRDGLVVERWSFMDAVPDDVARFFARS